MRPHRWPYRLVAFDPRRPMAPVVLKSRTPLDDELEDLRSRGYVIESYRAPGKTIKNLTPVKVAVDAPAVADDAPGTATEPPAQAPAPMSKRAQLVALVAEIPASDPRTTSELAKDLAPVIGLHPGTARRYLADIRKAAQTGAAA